MGTPQPPCFRICDGDGSEDGCDAGDMDNRDVCATYAADWTLAPGNSASLPFAELRGRALWCCICSVARAEPGSPAANYASVMPGDLFAVISFHDAWVFGWKLPARPGDCPGNVPGNWLPCSVLAKPGEQLLPTSEATAAAVERTSQSPLRQQGSHPLGSADASCPAGLRGRVFQCTLVAASRSFDGAPRLNDSATQPGDFFAAIHYEMEREAWAFGWLLPASPRWRDAIPGMWLPMSSLARRGEDLPREAEAAAAVAERPQQPQLPHPRAS